jgi:hypothetical protein
VKFSRPPAAFVALAAVAGCGSEKDVTFRIAGPAPGAVVLFVRVVDDEGAQAKVHSTGDAEQPVKLPATVLVSMPSDRVGVVVWLADVGGSIVAQGRSEICAEMAVGGSYEVRLAPAPEGWSPATADRCQCDRNDPLGPMCPASSADGGVLAPDAGGPEPDLGAAPGDGAPVPQDAGAPDTAAAPDAAAPADAAPAAVDGRDAAADRSPDTRVAVTPMAANPIFGFESPGDWTSNDVTLTRDSARTDGESSLSFTVGARGAVLMRSRSFDTTAIGTIGTRMSLDVYLSEPQIGDASIEMWADCQSAALNGVYMGYKALTPLKSPGWSALNYTIPAPVLSAFRGKYSDCAIMLQLAGKGLFRYDRMLFLP